MPLTRYQIRNEYSLADPEIYRAPDKNDPEALLQGVAMAGLVGLLRQLGDLSEFAADLFHNLHEEVMATAGRSHGLMNRLQQVEADIPSVEKAFLTHTSDKKLLYNAGIEWHPNLRMDQNMITRGDLPRFVMDSYEECRGPPRLFLLDKFDIAGAGACSKRYSDPSFFKTDFTYFEKTKTASHREKKARKIKRRASLCRNGEASDIVPTTNSKLHQLFLEENNQTENIVPIHHVKLKRRQSNCSVLDPTTDKSYMQKFLGTSSPESKAVYENAASPLLLTMESGNSRELVPEIHEICIRSPDRKLGAIDRTPAQSPSKQDKVLEQSFDELIPDIELKSNPSTLYKVEDQKEFFGRDSKTEPSTDGYLSDDVTSEMDNFVDALTTMESEMETDVVNRFKYERGLNIEEKGEDFDTNEKQHKLQVQFSDTHSIGSSIAYDDGNVEVQNVISSSGKEQEYLTSVKNHPESNDVAEHKNLKMIDEVPPAELGSASSGFACSEVETSYNNLDGFSNTTVCDIQEGPALDWVHFDSVDTNKKSDIPLDFPSKYAVTIIREPSSVIEVHSQLADLSRGTSNAKADEEDSILDHNPIRFPSEDHINSGKCHGNGDSGEDKLGITEITAQRHLNGPDAKSEPVVGSSNFNELCDTQSEKPSISKLLNNVNDPPLVECSHDCSNLSDDFNYPSSWRKSDQQLASKDPPQSHLSDISEVTKLSASHSPPELEASLEQGLEIKADVLNVWSLHEDEDIEESLNHIDCDDRDEPSVSSYVDPLCQPSEPKFSLLPTSHKPERSKVSEAIHEQPLDSAPSTAALDFSQPDHSALQANMEETTALPPLTPKQWKEGMLQDGSQTSEGEGVRPSFNLYSQLSPPATDQRDQHGFPTLEGKLAHPLSEPNTDDEKPQQGPQIFDGKLVQPCIDPLPSLPATKSEKIQQDTQTLERKVALPLDPILSLTVMEQEKPQHGSLTSRIESLHPGMNPFQYGEHTSLTSEGVLQQPWNSFAPPVREDEKSQNISSALKEQLVQPLDSFTGSTTTEDGKPEHGDLYTNGGMTWQWHSSPVAPDVEDGKPNEVLTKRIPRPRNPLAEEFVSRDKIMLKKVEERVLPQLRPNVVGRDSLLEQIRTKSFNLKPAVATRPSIKGPNTNLKVVAILEKANAIRLALAGSDDDDDDDDSWSDS